MSHVYVLVEHEGDKLASATGELITAARALGVVSAVVVGQPGTAESLREELAALGAEQIIDAHTDDYSTRLIAPEVQALHALGAANPAPIVIAGTLAGNEIAGRLGVRLSSGVLVNVSAIDADRSAVHTLFGGSVDAVAVAGGQCPIYTLRPGSVKAEPKPASGTIAPMPLGAAADNEVRVRAFEPAEQGTRPALVGASTVVAGGRGVGSAEGFASVIEPLADSLGAAVGATRDAVDAGWYAPSAQIGQTGETVSPELYIGLGISGAIQHLSGMQTSGTIVVINQDGDEPFFSIADLGVVGDLHEIAPALTEELRKRAQA
ncbi:electron transfer flavoprotein subunit alpha/FixB family protein [Corynebacterium tapiri]|uniref:Electron transfer flavoprotein subunit alpha/FixB family protein n=1 Tax=Corynebacterium tapiri TaxID=1448266 RepID=A0A5C4U775_9CORY|nr:electron transfer flavoprotein subunit alpha/FixB family protein [Corynebacterium tapiri]TNL99754.1 electron transfer flavoprotein subunit alpha/FixB family protein [Corynebacterium tapiri]